MTIPPQLEEKAALYALDLLDAPEREAFASRLENDAGLRALVDDFRESLSLYAAAEARSQSPSPEVEERLLRGIRSGAEEEEQDAEKIVFPGGASAGRQAPVVYGRVWTWLWPAAALVMLGLNLFLVSELRDARSVEAETGEMVRVDPALFEEYGIPAGEPALARRLEALHAERDRLRGHSEDAEIFAAEAQSRIRLLEESNESLVFERDAVLDSLDDLAGRAAPLLGGHKGFARYTVMELMTDEAREAGRGPLGLAQLAGSILQSPGIAMVDRDGLPEFRAWGSGRLPEGGADMSGPADAEDVPRGGAAFALSVFDETTGRGFMDIYNLPEPEEGTNFHLWLRGAVGDIGFVAVGGLPEELSGRSGSLFFEVPPGTVAPVEIIVTAEESTEPGEPGGPVVLRGP
ncbi:MAG: hypothetical protein JJU00_08255 [Opitutales bacterium]|nr:hypothetical protein [Opitutales bacterium]